ncbi:MAG: hypothetical protein LBG92_01735 [Prevotellaceae bacterium]|nr:hypothetical protein [Prevotellaceae bacterium]
MLCVLSPCLAQTEKPAQMSLNKAFKKHILEKTWIVDSIFVDKTVGGVVVVKNLANDTVSTFLRRPKKIIIEPKKIITFEYADGLRKTGTFSIQDNKISVLYSTHVSEYEVEVTDNALTFRNQIQYLNNGVLSEERYVIKTRADNSKQINR